MKSKFAAVLSMILVVSLFASLYSALADDNTIGINADAEIDSQLKAFSDLKTMFIDKKELADIQKAYVDQIQSKIKAIDATLATDAPKIDETITFVLDNAAAGRLNAAQAQQATDKGLQWYFYFLLKDLINKQAKPALEAGDKTKAKVALDKAIQVYKAVLEPTVLKRDNKFKTTMVEQLAAVIAQLQSDIENGALEDFNVHRQMIDKTLIKMFSLATLTYAESIPTKSAADQPAAITEGYFFYMAVYTYLKGGSAADADYVKDAFASGDASKIELSKIQAAIQRAMIGKVSEYMSKTIEKLEAGDIPNARVYAMEGAMFLAAQETFLGEAYADASVSATVIHEAVAKGDKAGTQKYAFAIMKHLVGKDGVYLKIGDKKLTVNGAKKTAAIASFVNKDTHRTLVPARFIAEALNATVDYIEASKTVVIVKDGKKTELTVGKNTVVQDGAINEKVKLDQQVIIKDKYSFIPVRAVAELFGKRVFYYNGEVIIAR